MPHETMRISTRELVRFHQRPKGRSGALVVLAGVPADIGTHYIIEDALEIGRETPGLQLRDAGISRRHAKVLLMNEVYLVRDLGSTNGTLLNGVRIEGDQPLRDGDQIGLGQTVLRFDLIDENEANFFTHVQQYVGVDALTGLVAKHRFDAALEEAVKMAQTYQRPLVAMMMDMDGLKAINDRHGHHVGAHTIQQVGQRMGELLRGRGEACRFGGDEFSAFIPGIGLNEGMNVAEQIRQAVATEPVSLDGVTVQPTISIGVAVYIADVDSGDALLRLADRALYRAKAAGRNCVKS